MSMLGLVAEVALLDAVTQRRDPNNNQRKDYGALKMLGAFLCFEALSEAFDNIGIGLGGAALALGATEMLTGGNQAAGAASAAAAATPAAVTTPRATPQPSLGLNLAPTAPTMGM